jgi:hypothetical protein
MIEILNRYTKAVLYRAESSTTLLAAIKQALASDANLSRADLRGADLRDANLRDANLGGADLSRADLSEADLSSADLSRANLSYANLSGADLSRADLSYANLSRADLSGADLSEADLSSADLSRADLSYANLSRADLSEADLSYANLSYANLSGADLSYAKEDLFKVLDCATAEVPGLLLALRNGRVDGSVYEGKCACLVGTLANVRGCNYRSIPGLVPDSSRPAERWFYGICKGMPAEHPRVAKTIEWIEEWQATASSRGAPPSPDETSRRTPHEPTHSD